MPDSTAAEEIAFDRCVIRRDARQLLVDGKPAKLGARALDLLLVLVEHRDRVVSKNELLNLVWPGLVVEENNLQVHISALRKLLGPQAIATIPGRGYRFTALPVPQTRLERRSADRPDNAQFLFGRDADIKALADLVVAHRLVTITGEGGIGKTVLAQAVARSSKPAFADGVWVVDLAPQSDASQVAAAVAGGLQVTLAGGDPAHALAEAVRERHMLIVLDNCEHLTHAIAALAATLLRDAPKLHLLATSQEPLKLVPERVYRVTTLALPARATLEDARQSGAVRLFECRAQSADQRFVLNASNVEAVVEICAQLDGIALAIELGAARVQLLGIQGLRDRLGQRLFVLSGGSRTAPPRQRTLRAALEWSHTLLSPEQQAVFRRLGVMSGAFGLDASQQVAAFEAIDQWAVLDHLGALVEKSLVAIDHDAGGEMRYRLLETMRQFALERLAESGEQHATRERHLSYFLALAEQAKPQLTGPAQGAWLNRLDLDRDNLFGALAWCDHAEDGAARGLRLVNGLMRYWLSRGLLVQGHHAYVEALARAGDGGGALPRLRCEAQLHAGSLCAYRNLDAESEVLLRESVAIARAGGFTDLLAQALSKLGFARLTQLDRVEARSCLEESLVLSRTLSGETGIVSQAATTLAELERVEGHLDAAAALYEESLRHTRNSGDRLRTMIGLNNLAMVAVVAGDDATACTMLLESLAISDELGSRRGRLVVMEVCAGLAAHRKQWALAARFDGAADTHTVQMGRRRDIADAAFLAPFVARASAALGPAGYAHAQAAGGRLNYDDAVAATLQWLTQA